MREKRILVCKMLLISDSSCRFLDEVGWVGIKSKNDEPLSLHSFAVTGVKVCDSVTRLIVLMVRTDLLPSVQLM